MYGLFTFVLGEKLPHEQGGNVERYSVDIPYMEHLGKGISQSRKELCDNIVVVHCSSQDGQLRKWIFTLKKI